MNDLPARLRAARRAQRHRLEDAGQELGVTGHTVWMWEAGRQGPHELRIPAVLAYIHAGELAAEIAQTTGDESNV